MSTHGYLLLQFHRCFLSATIVAILLVLATFLHQISHRQVLARFSTTFLHLNLGVQKPSCRWQSFRRLAQCLCPLPTLHPLLPAIILLFQKRCSHTTSCSTVVYLIDCTSLMFMVHWCASVNVFCYPLRFPCISKQFHAYCICFCLLSSSKM